MPSRSRLPCRPPAPAASNGESHSYAGVGGAPRASRAVVAVKRSRSVGRRPRLAPGPGRSEPASPGGSSARSPSAPISTATTWRSCSSRGSPGRSSTGFVVNGACPASLRQLRAFQARQERPDVVLQEPLLGLGQLAQRPVACLLRPAAERDRKTLPGFTPDAHRDLSLGQRPAFRSGHRRGDVMNSTMTTAIRSWVPSLVGSQRPWRSPSRPSSSSSPTCSRTSSLRWTCRLRVPTSLDSCPFGSFGSGPRASRRAVFDMYTHGYELPSLLSPWYLRFVQPNWSFGVLVAALRIREQVHGGVRREADLPHVPSSRGPSGCRRWPLRPRLACPQTPTRSPSAAATCCCSTLREVVPLRPGRRTTRPSRAITSPTDVLVRTGLTNIEALAQRLAGHRR